MTPKQRMLKVKELGQSGQLPGVGGLLGCPQSKNTTLIASLAKQLSASSVKWLLYGIRIPSITVTCAIKGCRRQKTSQGYRWVSWRILLLLVNISGSRYFIGSFAFDRSGIAMLGR
jgi:hypothetical protein